MSEEYLGINKKVGYGKDVKIVISDDGSLSSVLMPYRKKDIKKTRTELEKELDKDILDYFRRQLPPAGA